ncbi:uncharacterized protein LOC122370388 [Amphibalanus amphitrite]|uniref:uncharacterized protein LOC122370388 n=1 Tax=Amphibalanus amphitrite TaxID=1232801 RepID=UPI001C9288F0|nr:uncharacterized protein LOC122370388 [Amphibalanus amphitrite]
MAGPWLTLITLGWWVSAAAAVAPDVFPLDACPAGDIATGPDGFHCSSLPVEFTTDGIYHMRQSSGEVLQVYCDMSGGRWNEIMRRGVDSELTPVAPADQLSFAGSPGSTDYDQLYGDLHSEFFVGKTDLGRFAADSSLRTELMVEVETTDDEYYFAIFKVASLQPIEVKGYFLGNAGAGLFDTLNTHSFNGECSEAWYADDCTLLSTVDRPHLTRPLDGTPRADGSWDWPTVQKPLKRISMKVRVNKGEFCTRGAELSLALSPQKLLELNADLTMSPSITTADVAGTSAMATNVTITCRDPSKVIITKDQYQINDYSAQSSSKTFICRAPSQNAMFDDLPVAADAICMTPCPADYTLVAPTEWTVGAITDTVNRLSCLSPVVDRPGLGPYKAAQLCGQRGEQLLDFPVPKDRLNNPSGFSLITAMHYSKDPQDNVMKIRDLRGTFMPSHQFDSGAAPGDYSNGDRCVALYEDPAVDPPGTMVRHSECYNTEHRFVCMKNVGCDAEHFFHEGFCYNLLIASSVKDHMDDCYPDPKNVGGRNGMPAVPTSSLLTALAARPDNPDLPVAVGVYRRHDGFFMMDEPIADTDITISDPAELCAVLDMTAGALTSMACNENTVRPALCQYPGLPQKECPTVMKLKYPSSVEAGSGNPNSHNQVSTVTAANGYNFYEQQFSHTLEYKCLGLMEDWELQTNLDSLTVQDVSHWAPAEVLACTTDDQSGYPANSNFSQAGPHLIHACRFPLQTANFETDQQQTCNHANYLYEGAVIDCDQCMMNPLAPHSDMTLTSDWDSVARTLGTVVNYSCSAGLTTVSGDMVQQQTCTLDGWAGDIVQCDTCEWLPSFNASSGVNISVTGGMQFGGLVEMACLPGLEAADGSVFSSAICTPDAWNLCHTNFSCDFCHGPPLNHTVPAYVSGHDWDGSTRIQGTVVTYTCEGATVTASGLQEQYQNCTDLGWVGEISDCGVCAGDPMNATGAASRRWDGTRTVGAAAWYHCAAGTATADGATLQNQTCTTSGWEGTVLLCDTCIGEPVNVTGMTTITSSFTGDRQIGDQVTYTCQAPLTTSAGQQLQTVNCTDQGWLGDVLPCEVCPPPPAGNHSTIRHMDTSGNFGDRLGSSITYHCNHHLYTAEGHNRIQAVCEASGWTVCEPEIECNFCADLGDVSQYGGTLTWDYTGVREVGTVVTLTCGTGLATPELNTTQTLTCGLNGWNRAVPCSVCTDPAPTPPASLEPNVTWTLGDPTAIYTCLESKKFAWGLTTFEMTCSPTGWPCVPECEYCAGSPNPPAGVYPTDVFYNPGGQATYQCSANMQTALNDTVQTLTCVETGWEGDLLPCDVCIGEVTAPSPGQNRIWSGNNTVDTIVTYECVPGMETEEGTTYQTRNCTTDGWTPPPLPCDLCNLAPGPRHYMSRDWSGNRTVNSTATYTCHGNLTTMANETEQTITCTETGWSAPVQPCAMCKDPIPDAGNSTERNMTSWVGWRLPGATVEYLCSTGAVQTVTCTGSGWEPEVLPPCCLSRSSSGLLRPGGHR